MKIKHNLKKCIGCGSCVSVCPKVFKMGEDGKAHLKKIQKEENGIEVTETDESCAEDAKNICPVQCIEVEK